MNLSKFIFSSTLLFCIISISTIQGQNKSVSDYSREFLLKEAKDIMINSGTCTLITLDSAGVPRARIMDPFAPEDDLSVWFGTNSKSRKVDQIKKDSRVSIYYFDAETTDYVLIHGNAQLVNDQQEKENRWKEKWNDFYPNRSEGYLLIKVAPIWMEILSTSRGIYGDAITWKPPTLIFETKEQ